MSEWTKVVTNPLGLGGFALFLVFSLLARAKSLRERRWAAPTAFSLAALALIGGLALAWAQVYSDAKVANKTQQAAHPSPTLNCQSTSQTSTGAASPNVNCVQGPVVVTIDQSSGKSGDQTKSQQNKKENGK